MKAKLVILSLFVLLSCTKRPEKIKPTVENISESVYASGIIKCENQYQVFSTVNGILKEILVDEGDSVKAGQPLFRIENRTAVLNVKNAQLAADYAKLSANQQRLTELSMAIDLARNKMKNDSLLLDRQQKLWSQNIGTRVELEQRQLSYDNSLSNFKSLQIQYRDLQRQLEFNARQSQNNYAISSTQADDYVIKSETQGKVYSILKEPGELVAPQSPVALIGDIDKFYLELQVDEYDITLIKPHQKVLVSMDSYKGEVFEAVVTRIVPLLHERSKSFTVEAHFTKQPSLLYPFLTAEANIIIGEKKDALTIPRNYLVNESFVLTENQEKIKVITGLKDYQKVEIVSGLTRDDFITKPEP